MKNSSPHAIAEYYDRIGGKYQRLFRDELDGKPFDRDWIRVFAVSLGAGAIVCDAGCGPCGHVSRLLSAHGVRVIGVDVSRECLKLARSEDHSAHYAVMDISQLAFPAASLDGIIAYYSIIYTPKSALPALLCEFHRVLKPSGKLLIAVKEGDGEGLIEDPLGSSMSVYFSWFGESELCECLARCGFTVTDRRTREPYPAEISCRRIHITCELGRFDRVAAQRECI